MVQAAEHSPPAVKIVQLMTELRELESCVHTDGIAQLVPQDALFAVVGQLEQVEARWWSGKSTTWLLLADGEKTPEDTAKGVSSVLNRVFFEFNNLWVTRIYLKLFVFNPYLIIWNFHTADRERWFEVGKT